MVLFGMLFGKTLADLRAFTRFLADHEDTARVTDAELDQLINLGVLALNDMFQADGGHEHWLKTDVIPVSKSASTYALPHNIATLYGVDFSKDPVDLASDQYWNYYGSDVFGEGAGEVRPLSSPSALNDNSTLWIESFSDVVPTDVSAEQCVTPLTSYTFHARHTKAWDDGSPTKYRLFTAKTGKRAYTRYAAFPPTPPDNPGSPPTDWEEAVLDSRYVSGISESNHFIRLQPAVDGYIVVWYAPEPEPLVEGTDELEGFAGFEEYVCLYAACRLLDREESDSTQLRSEMEAVKTRIRNRVVYRDRQPLTPEKF